MAGRKDFTIEQGATWTQRFTWKAGKPSLPVNLTGCTGRMEVRATRAALTPLFTLTTENGGISFEQLIGRVTLTVDDDTTRVLTLTNLQPGLRPGDPPVMPCVYDLEIYHSGSLTTRLLEGFVFLKPEVTRG